MFRRTRALFLHFVQDALDDTSKVTQKAIVTEWNQKTGVQKERFTSRLEDAWRTEREALVQRPLAAASWEALLQLNGPPLAPIRDPGVVEDWIERCQLAITEFTKLKALAAAETYAWLAFRMEFLAQPTELPRNDDIVDNIDQQRNAKRQSRYAADARLLQLKDMLNKPPVAPDPNGDHKMRRVWISSDRQDELGTQAILSAARDNNPNMDDEGEGTWHCQKRVRENEEDVSNLWLKVDQEGRIIDRMVRKDVNVNKEWFDLRTWGNNVDGTLAAWEICCMNALETVNNMDHMEKIRGFEDAFRPKKWYRICKGWYPFGTVADLINDCRRNVSIIPEPMIWCVAQAITKCCFAMQYGTYKEVVNVQDTEDAVGGWKPVVHRDLRPQNILLGRNSDANSFSSYPMPSVGNFRRAIRTTPTEEENPQFWMDNFEPGFAAPEMIEFVNRDTLQEMNPWPLGEKTNVFGIGLVLHCMVTLTTSFRETAWLGDPSTDDTYRLNGTDKPNVTEYSDFLIDLIDDCTKYDPAERLGLVAICKRMQEIHRFANNDQQDWAIATETMQNGGDPGIEHAYRLEYPRNDQYAVGFARPPEDDG